MASFQELFSGKRFVCCALKVQYVIYIYYVRSVYSLYILPRRYICLGSDISAIDLPTLLASSLLPRLIRHFISCEVASPDIKWRMGLGTRLTS